MRSLEGRRAVAEESYHAVLKRRAERGKNILKPGFWRQAWLVLSGLAIALVLSWFAARAASRPVLPLIAAARRTGSGLVDQPAAVPTDPDLAQVAFALNEMTALVASRAREEGRRQLLDRTISSLEDERRRIARELHDDVGQSLSALLMELRAQKSAGVLASMLGSELEVRVLGLIDSVYRMALDLRPALLDDLGLIAALGRQIEELTARHGLPIDFQSVGLEREMPRLPRGIKTALYRVAQEALHNIMRHAHAQRVSLVVIRRPDEVVLLVEDDGVGFDVESIRHSADALGVLGMEERVTLCGGTLTIESTPGQGTNLRARIPLSEAIS
ncbi:MAG TPA: sensor histidine kinase [Polyangiales bacterium]